MDLKMFGLLLLMCVGSVLANVGVDPDVGKDMIQIVQARGYPVEEHFVETADGYILGMFHIPHGRTQVNATGKPVVFLQHGLEDSSYTWVNNFANQSFAYILADQGYDVWLGNNRGNAWSKRHKTFKTDSTEFWNFTWVEMAQYDLPAQVDYVLKYTGEAKLSYVGHSQGTIQAFAAFSSQPELTNKINFFGALAPVAYVSHMTSPLLDIMITLDIDKIVQFLGFKEFLPDSTILQLLAPGICDWVPWGCDDFLFLIVGEGHDTNQTRIQVYVSETPSGTSVKNIVHWSNNARAQTMAKYDYGCGLLSCPNMEHYGQRTPPEYDLSKVNVPTGLYYADKDTLADPDDVGRLLYELPDSTVVHTKHYTDYNHLDFVWGQSAATRIYADLIEQIKKYQ